MNEEPETTVEENVSTLFEDDLSPSRKTVPVKQQLMILALLLLVIFGSGLVTTVLALLGDDSDTDQMANTSTATETVTAPEALQRGGANDDVTITATAAFVWDVNTQRILYAKNPDERLPLASLTKLMTALVAHEIVASNSTITIPESAIDQDGESGLSSGETFNAEELSDLTLISSSNDGAFALANAAGAVLSSSAPTETFVQAMNIRADELGLSQTYYRNPTGLDLSETEAGAYGSARDTAFLVEYILKHAPTILEVTNKTDAQLASESGVVHQVRNTNQTVDDIVGILGSKTGYTTLAGGNLAIAFDASLNRPVIVVVLGSTYNGRFSDVVHLSEYARNVISQ